jgi:drug/metabolite transporter (DMT)-like permease
MASTLWANGPFQKRDPVTAVVGGLALALVSAIASSSAHALLKSGEDKLAVQAWTQFTALLIAVPFIFWVGLPEPVLWIWLFAGWLLHTAYYLVLNWSYSNSDYSVAYPVARGMTPISTAILGVALLGDQLGLMSMAGVVIISAGILLLTLKGSITRGGLMAALSAGLLNTAFTLTDAQGMRLAANPANFLVWYYVIDGISMPLLLLIRTKGNVRSAATSSAKIGFASGIISVFAFLPTLIAFRIAPVGAVSAIRATSVIFSLMFGGRLLKEQLDGRRVGGAILVTLGAVAIIAGTALR